MSARPPRLYARALLETASSEWLNALQAAQRKLRDHPQRARLEDPAVAWRDKQKILKTILPDGASPEVKNFFKLLVKENRLNMLDEIVTELEGLTLYGPEAQTVLVTTAVPLIPEEERRLRQVLTARFGERLVFRFQVDPEILGGAIIRVGDKVIDGSIEGKLRTLHHRLAGGR